MDEKNANDEQVIGAGLEAEAKLSEQKTSIGLAGIHADDFLLAGDPTLLLQVVSQLHRWRSTQSGPQFLAEISLLFSEIGHGAID